MPMTFLNLTFNRSGQLCSTINIRTLSETLGMKNVGKNETLGNQIVHLSSAGSLA